MTTTSPSTSSWSIFRNWIKQPIVAGSIITGYLIVAIALLLTLDRSNILFPIYSTIAFPAFVLSPFIILAAPLPWRLKVTAILLLLLIIMPLIGLFDASYLELAIQICIYAGLALGLNIVVGFAGLLDLGYIAFFAVGAYIWAMFTSAAPTIFRLNGWIVPGWAFFLFIFVGVTLAAVVGILLGLPVLRLRGDYLAIVTLGFGEMIRVLANNADQPINLTNGSQGLQGVGRPPLPPGMIDTVSNIGATLNIHIANIEPVTRQLFFYFIAIIILAIVIVIARRLDDSVIGRAWTAIREDEIAAIAMGVPLVRMKLMAFASGAAFAGAIGVLYAAKQTFVSPESFSLTQSISVLAMVIVGGLGGIRGVILGGCVVTLLNLQVLKNLSLQINNWKNTDAVLPGWVIALVIVALVVLIAWIIWRIRSRQDWSWSTRITAIVPLGVIAIALMAALTQVSDFRMKTWPAQLEPAKYEQLVFGILLILMMLFRPAGILPEPRRQMEMQKRDQTEGDIKLKSTPAGQSG